MDIKEALKKEYKYRVEAHAHTRPVSPCGEATPEELVNIYKQKGYDAIVIANHYIDWILEKYPREEAIKWYLKDFYEAKKAGEKAGLNVLLGAEIRFSENVNDYLIYGVSDKMIDEFYDYLKDGVENFRKNYKMENSVFVQAHPFRDGMELIDSSLLDGVETFNMHPGHNSRIAFANLYAKENDIKVKTAGSDFHHLGKKHEGICAIRCKTLPKDSFEFAKILKSGDYIIEIADEAIIIP